MAKRSEWAEKRIQAARAASASTEADFPTPEPIDPLESRLAIVQKAQSHMKGGKPAITAWKQAKGTVYDLRILLLACEHTGNNSTTSTSLLNKAMDASRLAWDVIRRLADAVGSDRATLKRELKMGDSEAWSLFEQRVTDARTPGKITKDEANVKAREYLSKDPTISQRKLADLLGCSVGLVAKLSSWKAVQGQLKEGRTPKTPRTVSLTDALESTCGEDDPELQKLIEEQDRDMKNDAGKHFRQRRKL